MWLLLFFVIPWSSAEVISLTKDNTTICVLTKSSVYSALYPTSATNNQNRQSPELNSWDVDDWNVGTTKELSFSPVMDIRWESFEVKQGGKIKLDPKATSFSVCFDKKLVIHVGMKTITLHQEKTTKKGCNWGHYLVENKKILRVTNETTQVQELDFVPQNLMIPEGKMHKKHNYDFRYSYEARRNTISMVRLNEVTTSSHLCVSFFVSVDKGCYLNVTLQSKFFNTIRVEGFNNNSARSWKHVTVKIDSYNGTGNLQFLRGGQKSGFWAIDDIHLCKPEIETVTNSLCKTLEESKPTVLCTTPGLLGSDCSTTCASTLGKSYQFCEGHKICSGDSCTCAWGYQGDFCNEQCEDKHFGLNCSSKCDHNCKNFSTVVGCVKCEHGFFGNSCSAKLPVVLKPPKLTKITNNSLEISLEGLEYGEGEAVPTHYTVQYKKDFEHNFSDFGTKPYTSNTNKIVVNNVEPQTYNYKVRVLLKVDNFVEETVPELVTLIRSLTAKTIGTTVELTWRQTSLKQYFIDYTCNSCHQQTRSNFTTSETKATLENVSLSSNCTVRLFQNEELIDEIEVSTSKIPTVSVSKSNVTLTFPDCSEPSSYFVHFQCASEWCQHKNVAFKYVKGTRDVDLVPFSNYTVEIKSVTYNITSPSSTPQPVTDFAVYGNNDATCYLKWKPAYPPTGVIEKYQITYFDSHKQTNKSVIVKPVVCSIWKQYQCAQINDIKPDFYNIEIRGKNQNVSEWSNHTSLTFFMREQLSQPPLHLHVNFSSKRDEVFVRWQHPQYTHGLLEKFNIDVDDGSNHKHTEIQAAEQYEYKLPVESNNNYDVTVWGTSRTNSSSKAVLNVTIFPPVFQISTNFLVQWCDHSCYLLVPNDKRFNIMVKSESVVYLASKSEVLVVNLGFDEVEEVVYSMEDSHHVLLIKTMRFSDFSVLDSGNNTVFVVVAVLVAVVVVGLVGYLGCRFRSVRKTPQVSITDEYIYLVPHTPSTLIKSEDLEDHVRGLHEATNLLRLKHFFSETQENRSCTVASNKDNTNKNKDQRYIPCDSTRVILQDLEGVNCGDYINASYINGYQHSQKYIACQGPKFNTVSDFWRMIWTEKVDTIVMATNFVESDGNRNSADYWSPVLDTVADFGNVTVKMTTERTYQHYIFRIFEVSYSGCVRKVRHLQAKWGQDRCPHPEEVVAVLKKLWSLDSHQPIVVHSCLGTNRTGMLILCDLAVKTVKSEGAVDFVNLFKKLRDQRPLIIHKFEYFILAHLTVLECLLEEQNPFRQPVEEILKTNCSEEVVFLERLSLHDSILLPQLRTQTIQGYNGNQITLYPLSDQKDFEFWETTLKNDFQFVVYLNSTKDQLWPLKMRNSGVKLTVVDQEIKEISSGSVATQLLVQQSYRKNDVLREKKLWFYELLDWDCKKVVPESNTNILTLLQQLRSSVKEHDHILLVSRPESNAGLITSIVLNALEKYEYEREIDVYGFLRSMMRNGHFRIQAVELKFIYAAIVEYLDNFDLKTHVYQDVE